MPSFCLQLHPESILKRLPAPGCGPATAHGVGAAGLGMRTGGGFRVQELQGPWLDPGRTSLQVEPWNFENRLSSSPLGCPDGRLP